MSRFASLAIALLVVAAARSVATQRQVIDRLLQLAPTQPASDAFKAELIAAMRKENIHKGSAIVGNGPDFIWAVESADQPVLFVNDEKYAAMERVSGNLWFHAGKLATGNAYKFHYVVNGAIFGGALNIPAYTPDSYAHPGVPQGTLSERMVHISRKTCPCMKRTIGSPCRRSTIPTRRPRS
jgi:hypothetical protein